MTSITTSTGGIPLDVATIIGDIQQYSNNPAQLVRNAFAAMDAINNGTINIVDATNPFVLAIENTCVNTAAAMQTARALTRRQYPAAATTVEDLYIHMADTDFANIFALPTNATFTIMVSMRDLLNALIINTATNIGQVTIPRNTVFYASGIPFSLQYPINIQQLPHSGLQVIYDTQIKSPLQDLASNDIPYSIIYDTNGNEYLSFEAATQQFDIIEKITTVSGSGGFSINVPYSDQYYYCRVYVAAAGGAWSEIRTTYTEQVFDPNVPTAVIGVGDNVANVSIPIIYVTNGTIRGKVRVDVYETKGPISVALGNYTLDQFSADFIAFDQNDNNEYVSAFTTINGVVPYSRSTTTGGRAALNFTDLQQRVISSSTGPRNIPITPSQIQTTLIDLGYSLVKNVDTITNRQYLAIKSLPDPTSPNLVTPANAGMLSLITNLSAGANAHGCTIHDTGMTVTSSALLQVINGVTKLVTRTAYQAIKSQSLAEQCIMVNNGDYYYSPFYYVLDTTDVAFQVNPYFLDAPLINSCGFIATNAATQIQVAIAPSYAIAKTSTGYQLTISTNSNSNYQELPDNEVFCQLSFTSSAQGQTAYLLGVQQSRANNSGERTYVFTLDTNYDINTSDQMIQSSFNVSTSGVIPRSNLVQDITVIFGTTNAAAQTAAKTSIDHSIGSYQINGSYIGITQQSLNIEFGYSLANLWNSYRANVSPIQYQTYSANVPAVYLTDIYAADPLTGSIINKDASGNVIMNKIHSKNDPILDNAGHPTYLHLAGDTVLDDAGNPVPVVGYKTLINYVLDVMVLDAIYQFANDPITMNYVEQINKALINSLTVELATINGEVLENTQVFYYPAITKGSANVVVDNNQVLNMEMALSPIVTLYVTQDVHSNADLLSSLTSITIKTIGSYLQNNTTVSVSGMEKQLQLVYGTDVEGVAISGFGDNANYNIISVTDMSAQLGIKKLLAVQPNNQLAVQEGIQVLFKLHTPSNI